MRDFARALLTGGHEAEALALFDRLRASGDGPALEPGLAMYLSCTGKADEMETLLRSETEGLGGDRIARDALQVRLKTALAWTLVSLGKIDEARVEFDRLGYDQPTIAHTHLMFAAAGRSGDSVDAAIRELDQLKSPRAAKVSLVAAITLAAGGYPEAAERWPARCGRALAGTDSTPTPVPTLGPWRAWGRP